MVYSDDGGTGKSTLLDLLRALLSADAIARVPPGKLNDDRHACVLRGKVLNAADELPDRAVRSGVFKQMITGEPVSARDVYRSDIHFRPTALHAYSTNVLPNFSGGFDGGVIRRLFPLQFSRVVPEVERIPGLGRRIADEEPDLLLAMAVEGGSRLIRNKDFTVPASSKALLEQWTLGSDPVRAWVRGCLREVEPDLYPPLAVERLYRGFQGWAEHRRMRFDHLPSNISFSKRIYTAAPWLKRLRSDGSKVINARLLGID